MVLIPPNFSLEGNSLEASTKSNDFTSATVFPYLQPTGDPHEYPMVEYDL
jgi:hypothetical protein